MRLGRCLYDGESRSVLIDVDTASVLRDDFAFGSLATFSEPRLRAMVIDELPLGTCALLKPVDRPDKIICVGLNYRDHAAELDAQHPPYPSLFTRFDTSQVAHGQPIIAPRNSAMFDYEGELAVIIGISARNVSEQDAWNCIAGYSCFAENSARDFQQHGRQVTPGKNFESSGSFGPWITTADEVGNPSALELVTRLNGELMQHASLSSLIYSIANIISYVSSFTTLLPGDVIATGTPAGVGALRKPPIWLTPGDLLEVDIAGVGHLVNRVVAEGGR